MTEKIMQIIPAPFGLMAHYATGPVFVPEEATGNEDTRMKDVVCLALVDVGDGDGDSAQEVRAMVMNDSGVAVFADESEDFVFTQMEYVEAEEPGNTIIVTTDGEALLNALSVEIQKEKQRGGEAGTTTDKEDNR